MTMPKKGWIFMKETDFLKREKNILKYFIWSFMIIVAASSALCLIDNTFRISESVFGGLKVGMNTAKDFFLVEVQVAFITLSLSTALSTSSKRVYWVETYKYRLISPKYTNFTALSAYILATLLDGLIWCMAGWLDGICTISGVFMSFFVSVILLIILSARMIDANFGRDRIKRELERELKIKCDSLPTALNTSMDKGRMLPEIHKLMQVTIQEIDQKELDLVCENMLLLTNPDYKIEFKEVYNYARNAISSNTVMRELDYLIMKQIISDNRMDFFQNSWFIPEEEQYDMWERIINDVFDEAVSCWRSGNKVEALKKRENLYIVLTNYLYDKYNSQQYSDKDEENKSLIRTFSLMGLFVSRRQNIWFDGTAINEGLDKGWEESENIKVDHKEFICESDSENKLDKLVELEKEFGKACRSAGDEVMNLRAKYAGDY